MTNAQVAVHARGIVATANINLSREALAFALGVLHHQVEVPDAPTVVSRSDRQYVRIAIRICSETPAQPV